MRVQCKNNEGSLFFRNAVKKGHDRKTVYKGVLINSNYIVYGIIFYEGSILYLLYDEYKMANWYPAELFEVTEGHIPKGWCYNFLGYKEFGLSAVWGYNELVNDENHYDGLAEQENSAFELFLKRKTEIDKQVEGE